MAKASGSTRNIYPKKTINRAVKKFNEDDYKAYRKSGGSTQGYVANILGFKGAPKIIDKNRFDKLKNNPDYLYITRNVAVFDDINNDNIIEQRIKDFKKGGFFDGRGVHGDGYYFSYNGGSWGDKSSKVIEGCIKKSYIEDYNKVRDEWNKNVFENEDYIGKFKGNTKAAQRITDNFTAWATARGYAALRLSDETIIVLNRTKLSVKK